MGNTRSIPVPFTVTLMLLALLGTPALAAADDAKWYGGIKASISEDTIDNISQSGIGTGEVIVGILDGVLEDDSIDDHTAGFSVAVGRRMGYWNLELEYTYRYRTDWDIAAVTPSIATITNVFSNVETNSLLLNVARRGSISQHWSWELGAGAGLVYKRLDSDYIERETLTEPERIFSDSSSDADFSYSVFAGVTRDLGNPWTLNIRARYIDLGELEKGPFPGRAAKVSADQSAIELQFALERDL